MRFINWEVKHFYIVIFAQRPCGANANVPERLRTYGLNQE